MNKSIDRISESIEKKIIRAQKILDKGNGFFSANLENIFHEFAELNIEHSEAIWPLIRKLLKELKPDYYIKPKAMPSSNPQLEYFIFQWHSDELKRFVTLEFALNGEYFFYISLH